MGLLAHPTCLSAIKEFGENYKGILPNEATSCVQKVLKGKLSEVLADKPDTRKAEAALVFLVAFSAEMSHLLAGNRALESNVRKGIPPSSAAIGCFSGSTRSMVGAFGKREVVCEQLGAVHLLWHGIWD
jgi:hypothetical protein